MKNWVAFGAGVILASLDAMLLAVLRNDNNPLDYLTYCAIWFFVGYGSFLIALHWGDLAISKLEHHDRAAFLRLSIAEKEHKIDELRRRPIIEASSPIAPRVVYDRAAKWREWFISVFEAALAVSGIHYKGGLDGFMTYQLWRKVFCDTLSRHTPPVIEPVQNGDRTELRGGLTVESVLFLLKSGALALPYPDEYDPPPPIIRETQNAETRQKRDETPSNGQTVYGKDVKR